MKKSRLSQYKKPKLIELFVSGKTAQTVISLVGVNSKTAIYYFRRLREVTYLHSYYS